MKSARDSIGRRGEIGDLVDFDRYPVDDLATEEAGRLIACCRNAISAEGLCRLDGFVRPEAVARMAEEAAALAPMAHQQRSQFSPYIGDATPTDLPPDHPRGMTAHTAQAAVAWDRIPEHAALRRFYMWDGLTDLIGAALGKDTLYRSADPLAACNLTYIGDGDALGWHFDSSEFSITLLIQSPEAGGEFEFVPGIRTDDDERYDVVRDILLGGTENVRRVVGMPGTLSIFCGHHSIHRVTAVAGSKPRISAVLTYADRPGFTVSDYSKRMFYGRLE